MGSRIMALWPYWRPVAWLVAAWLMRTLDLWVPMLVWLAAMFTVETIRGERFERLAFCIAFVHLANAGQFRFAALVASALLVIAFLRVLGDGARVRLERAKFETDEAYRHGSHPVAGRFLDNPPLAGWGEFLKFWLPLFLWTLPIAYFSGGAGGAGSWRSWMAQFHLTPEQVETILWWVRKAIHFSYYGGMAWLAARAFGIAHRVCEIPESGAFAEDAQSRQSLLSPPPPESPSPRARGSGLQSLWAHFILGSRPKATDSSALGAATRRSDEGGTSFKQANVSIILALIWVIGHAGFDELRQAVTAGRTGSWVDFGIDMLGAVVAVMLFVRASKRKETSS